MIARFTDHAANERTFLAWIRTATGVAGFGLAAGRIGGDPSPWSEAALMGVGALVVLTAFVRMRVVRAKILDDGPEDDDSLPEDALLLALIALMFAMLGLFALHLG